MSESDVARPLQLDPFSFHSYTSSVIKGIGGRTPNQDPSYAFHTEYVRLTRGRANFHVRLRDLAARRGTLVLRVHLLPDEPGAVASMVTSARIQLNRLSQNGGEIGVTFEAFRGATYALMGLVSGDTDAEATDVTITVDRPYDPAADAAADRGDGQPTRFGLREVKGHSHLVSMTPPELAVPVSQIATVAQVSEPVFLAWSDRLNLSDSDLLARWSTVFVAQTLTTYKVLEPGAKGLVLGPCDPNLLRLLASSGSILTITDTADLPETDQAAREYRVSSLLPPADELVDFDFLCSTRLGERLDEPEMAFEIVESYFGCLRPQGLAVHCFGTGDRPPFLRRADMERMALNIVSLGHDVTQLRPGRYGEAADREAGAFGLIARRASMR